MLHYVYFKIFLMCFTIYMIRVIPFLLFKNEIKNRYIKSFFFYVPFVTIAVMTFPSVITSTGSIKSGTAAFITGVIAAWFGGNLFVVSGLCCLAVFFISFL